LTTIAGNGTLGAVRRYVAVVLLAIALAVTVIALTSDVNAAVSSAACLERAKFELILCAESSPAWRFPVLVGATILLSLTIGRFAIGRSSSIAES
jgi:hypothetical protein